MSEQAIVYEAIRTPRGKGTNQGGRVLPFRVQGGAGARRDRRGFEAFRIALPASSSTRERPLSSH